MDKARSTLVPKSQAQLDREADIKNGNWGTPGTNIYWDTAQGHRGTQIAENEAKKAP
jgi:hypothetical protein